MKSVRSRSPLFAVAFFAQLALAVAACDQTPEPQVPEGAETATGEITTLPGPICTPKCAADELCIFDPVVCVKAPCPPITKCVPAGPPKPGRCAVYYCPPGSHCEETAEGGVRCVKDQGEKCGAKVCGVNEYCCSESCGICTPKGDACVQRWCGPPRL